MIVFLRIFFYIEIVGSSDLEVNLRILICQLRNHGDIIRCFPLIDAIKAIYKDAFIGFTCFPEMIETCALCNNIDVVIAQPRFKSVTDTQDETRVLDCSILEDAVAEARKYNFDLYIDLHGVFQSALFGAICGIRTRLGRSKETAKDGASLFYTVIAEVKDKELNRMERHFIITRKILKNVKPVYIQVKKKNCITIFPGSSKKGILKRWSTDRYIEIANKYRDKYYVRMVLGPEESDLVRYIRNRIDIDIVECNSWGKISKLISESGIVIGNDGEFVHLAVWKGIPSIMICGPLSPVVNGIWKYGIGQTISVPKHCICNYLWQGKCDYNHYCIDKITVADVIKAVSRVEIYLNERI